MFHLKNTIFKNTQNLEELKSQMNWDQKALEAWLEESARKDEDSLTLQKYTRLDDGKVKVMKFIHISNFEFYVFEQRGMAKPFLVKLCSLIFINLTYTQFKSTSVHY